MTGLQIVGTLLLVLIGIVVVLVFSVGGILLKVSKFGTLGKLLAFLVGVIMTFVIGFLVVLACLVTTVMLF